MTLQLYNITLLYSLNVYVLKISSEFLGRCPEMPSAPVGCLELRMANARGVARAVDTWGFTKADLVR